MKAKNNNVTKFIERDDLIEALVSAEDGDNEELFLRLLDIYDHLIEQDIEEQASPHLFKLRINAQNQDVIDYIQKRDNRQYYNGGARVARAKA